MADYEQLQSSLSDLRNQLINHRLYEQLNSMHAMHVFMQHHVFAVWDFMSLLKTLQRKLTCIDVPWRPAASPASCRMINEIVLGEESDTDGQGGYVSHFELYVAAMQQAGADTAAVDTFLTRLSASNSRQDAFAAASVSPDIQRFVDTTFGIINTGDLCAIASAFTFGREELLPDVFQQIVARLNAASSGRLDRFEFYLRRHIELDGDEHGAMARQLMEELCGSDDSRWKSARRAAVKSLEARRDLWDAVADSLEAEVASTDVSG